MVVGYGTWYTTCGAKAKGKTGMIAIMGIKKGNKQEMKEGRIVERLGWKRKVAKSNNLSSLESSKEFESRTTG